MPHDHNNEISPSGHPYRKDQDYPLTYWQNLEIAVREILVGKKITTEIEIQETINEMDNRSPANGAKVIAKAWTDPDYKQRLLTNASDASSELGFDIGPLKLIALENTKSIHNVIVCTLCSCYPRNLLGLPPDWYKQRSYRSRIVKTPRIVLKEFGQTLLILFWGSLLFYFYNFFVCTSLVVILKDSLDSKSTMCRLLHCVCFLYFPKQLT